MTLGPSGRRWLATSLLAGMGAAIGALTGAGLTFLSHILIGLPRLPGSEYILYNATSFAILGTVLGPMIGWLALRRVPLWRAVAEPALVGTVAAAIAIGFGGFPFVLLPAFGVLAAAWRLNRAYTPRPSPTLGQGAPTPAPTIGAGRTSHPPES
jgi:MFS family permease